MRYFAHVKAAALSEEEIKERLKALNLGETGKKKLALLRLFER
jgi:hypothetical protein